MTDAVLRCRHCGARMSRADVIDARDAGYRLGDLCPDCIDVLVWGGELEPILVDGDEERSVRGQALIEFALVFPVLLLLIGAAIDGARLGIAKSAQDARTQVVVDWAASRPGQDWHAVSNELLPDCAVDVTDAPGKPGLLVAGSRCHFGPLLLHGLWDGLEVSAEAYAVAGEPEPSPTPSPEPSGSALP